MSRRADSGKSASLDCSADACYFDTLFIDVGDSVPRHVDLRPLCSKAVPVVLRGRACRVALKRIVGGELVQGGGSKDFGGCGRGSRLMLESGEHLYCWRYVERAEATARLAIAASDTILDLPDGVPYDGSP